MDEWVRDALVEDDEFKPHCVVTSLTESSQREAMPLFSQTTATQIFGKNTRILEKVSNHIVMMSNSIQWYSRLLSNWAFSSQSNWPESVSYYSVFGEIGIETWGDVGAQYVVEMIVEFPIEIGLERESLSSSLLGQFFLFSLTKIVTSQVTLILPGPWLEGKEKWDAKVTSLKESRDRFTPDQVSCLVTVMNPTSSRITARLSVMTPESIPIDTYKTIPLTYKETELGFGIEPIDVRAIDTLKKIKNVITETYALDLFAQESTLMRVERLVPSSNTDVGKVFRLDSTPSASSITSNPKLGPDSVLEYVSDKGVESPWASFSSTLTHHICSFPFLVALEVQEGGFPTVTVEYTTLGVKKNP